MKKIASLLAILTIVIALTASLSARVSAETAQPNLPAPPAASDTCQDILVKAMKVLEQACNTVERNRACYGNNNIQATLRTAEAANFKHPGDKLEIQKIKSLITLPFDENDGSWGLSLLKLQANLPDTLPGQNVTFLLYGDTNIDNTSGDMRTFYFSSGLGAPSCNEIPSDGILVRSPNHMKVAFTANGVGITIASTILMRAIPNQYMEVTLIEGQAIISTPNGTVVLEPGQKTRIPMGGANGKQAAGAPSTPEATVFSGGEADVINKITELDAKTDTQNSIANGAVPDTDDELVIEGCITDVNGDTITIYGYQISLAGLPPQNLGKGTCVSIHGKLKMTPRGLEVAASNIMKAKPPEKLKAEDAIKSNNGNHNGADQSNNGNHYGSEKNGNNGNSNNSGSGNSDNNNNGGANNGASNNGNGNNGNGNNGNNGNGGNSANAPGQNGDRGNSGNANPNSGGNAQNNSNNGNAKNNSNNGNGNSNSNNGNGGGKSK